MLLLHLVQYFSTAECRCSPCHKETFSKAGITYDLINLARPVRFSLRIGFFRGIADDPLFI